MSIANWLEKRKAKKQEKEEQKPMADQNKDTTEEERKKALDDKKSSEQSEQSTKDKADESAAMQEKDSGAEDSQTAKARVDESEGAEKADKADGDASSVHNDYQEFMLALYPPLRPIILEAMQLQLQYNLQNGLVQKFSGINIAKGTALDLAKVRGAVRIDPDAEIILQRRLPNGMNICYTGALPCVGKGQYREGH